MLSLAFLLRENCPIFSQKSDSSRSCLVLRPREHQGTLLVVRRGCS